MWAVDEHLVLTLIALLQQANGHPCHVGEFVQLSVLFVELSFVRSGLLYESFHTVVLRSGVSQAVANIVVARINEEKSVVVGSATATS